MKSLRTRFPNNTAVGLAIGEHEIVLARVALTLLGPKVIETDLEPFGGDPVDEALRRLLPRAFPRPNSNEAVAVGLPTLSLLHMCRPVKSVQRDATAKVLLHESLRLASLNIEDLDLDLRLIESGKSILGSVVGCRRKYLAPIVAALVEHGIRPHAVEPTPTAMLRYGRATADSSGKAKIVLHMFLGIEQGLAVLSNQDEAVLWKSFDHDQGTTLRSVYRSFLRSLAQFGLEELPSLVVIHGRSDLEGLEDTRAWQGESIRVIRRPTPENDGRSAAIGLALGCKPGVDSFNLAPEHRRPVSIWRRIPWGQILIQGGAVAASTALLLAQLQDIEASHSAFRAENDAVPWMKGLTTGKLKEQKTDHAGRVEAIRSYLAGRVCWTTTLSEIASNLPPTMRIDSWAGRNDFVAANSKSAAIPKTLTTRVEAPIPQGGAMPREIDELVTALKADTRLLADWPAIEMTNLKWNAGSPTDGQRATFTLLYQGKDAPAKPAKR